MSFRQNQPLYRSRLSSGFQPGTLISCWSTTNLRAISFAAGKYLQQQKFNKKGVSLISSKSRVLTFASLIQFNPEIPEFSKHLFRFSGHDRSMQCQTWMDWKIIATGTVKKRLNAQTILRVVYQVKRLYTNTIRGSVLHIFRKEDIMKKSIGPKTIVYPTPVFIVGTYDSQNKANAMAVAWGGISCSRPPCISISLRKATYSYGNIIEKKAFTINIPSVDFVREADYFGIVSGRNEDKFRASRLTPEKGKHVDAPIIKEFPMSLECKVVHTFELGLHTQFVGEIMDIHVEEDMLNESGIPDINKIRPILYDPSGAAYFGIGEFLAKSFSIGKEI